MSKLDVTIHGSEILSPGPAVYTGCGESPPYMENLHCYHAYEHDSQLGHCCWCGQLVIIPK